MRGCRKRHYQKHCKQNQAYVLHQILLVPPHFVTTWAPKDFSPVFSTSPAGFFSSSGFHLLRHHLFD
jgi:hypothetical protein